MDASEVSSLHDSMRKYGIPGILEPVDPRNRAGDWRVIDPADGRDITDEVIARVTAADQQQPTRGFIVAR
ncbi:hypothetical protein PUR59_04055 [Streptomyces sp. SP18ES09]|uniref:hypothetical protein n=1 Tax=Streptomyces sp. SP18ES09 TaxID=3002532 RepID=UPI002E762BC5|nr:hypothetical protein [Streptomyces sp. SP18ES09]MEE1814193.1 hypothetical protein [Streptomyces sp. SP18ES09]